MFYNTSGVLTVLPAPEGYVVNFGNPQRLLVLECYYLAAFGSALAILLFVQRMYVKVSLANGLQLDDVFLILALLTGYTTMGFSLHALAHGVLGTHIWEMSLENYNKYLLDVYVSAFLYPTSAAFAKISLLVFYLRLSPERWFKIAVWATIVIITAYTLGLNIPLIFTCKPMAMAWDVYVTQGTCVNRPTLYILVAVTNIVSDIVLFILPIPMVYKLQIPRRAKIGLIGIFGIGSVTVITSIVRVSILPELLSDPDGPWIVAKATVWTIVEGQLMIICASLPTLRKFVRHVAPKLLGESYGSGHRSRSHENGGTKTRAGSRSIVPSSQSRRDRHQYSQFDPENILGNDAYAMGPVRGQSGRNRSGDDVGATGWGDSDSEKAIIGGDGVAQDPKTILQTTTIKVEVEQADRTP